MNTLRFFTIILLILSVLLAACACGGIKNDTSLRCPYCSEECSENDIFCPKCGERITQQIFCSTCGHENAPDSLFCSKCGAAITSSTPNGGNNENSDHITSSDKESSAPETSGETQSDPAENIWLLVKSSEKNMPNGVETKEFFYDYYGNLIFVKYKENQYTYKNSTYTHTYDENHRLLKTSYSSYEFNNHVYAEEDGLDMIPRPQPNSFKGDGVIEYTYDRQGHLSKAVDKLTTGRTTEYIYDTNGCLKKETMWYGSDSPEFLVSRIANHTIYEEGKIKYYYYCDFTHSLQRGVYFVIEYEYDSWGNLSSAHKYNKGIPMSSVNTTEDLENWQLTGSSHILTEWKYTSSGQLEGLITYGEYCHFFGNEGFILLEDTSSGNSDHDCNSQCLVYTRGLSRSETFQTDEHGNIIDTSIGLKGYTFEYMTLAEYRQKGLYDNTNGEGGSYCGECKNAGYSQCQGHACTECNNGKETCAACHGTGKTYEFNGSDSCRSCYGLGWVICPTCDGSGKWFY